VNLSLGDGSARVNILNGVTIDLERGRSVAILGPSGSGKSSLLMVMTGLEAASSGQITVGGQSFAGLDEDGLARFRGRQIGIVFQSFHLIPTMTALENVAVPLDLAGEKDAFARARSELETVGLGHRLDHYPATLSGGEQQRVAIARALVSHPAILVADEPTGNLDAATGRQIADLLFAEQSRRSATLVLVTHDEALAARCDRIVRIFGGRIVADSRVAEAS
jgi:putative ABC transport system ATP-binding protein